jgi:enoyl-[acyl-carrier protein] reductase I
MSTETEEKLSIEFPKILVGKKALVSGIANKRSIAWGIAQALHQAGAEIVFSYQSERLKPELEKVLDGVIDNPKMVELDVSKDESLDSAFDMVTKTFGGKLDIMLHCLAFAPKETLNGGFVDTQREHYALAQDISAYSLAAMARKARPLMNAAGGGSIISLTYLGAEKVVPNYNMMGVAKAALEAGTRYLAYDLGPENIRVNAISAGPVKTLAARGIGDFMSMLKHHADKAPLKRNVDLAEIAGTALFLASSLSGGITGEVIHVDCGYSIVAM